MKERKMMVKRIISILLAVGLLAGTGDTVVLAQEMPADGLKEEKAQVEETMEDGAQSEEIQVDKTQADGTQTEEIQAEETQKMEDSEFLEKTVSEKATNNLPSIANITVTAAENLKAPGTVQVSVTVKDPTGRGVQYIGVDFAGPNNVRAAVDIINDGNTRYPGPNGATYTAILTLSKYLPVGVYQPSFIMLTFSNGDVQYTPSEDGKSMVGNANGVTVDSFLRNEAMSFTIKESPDGDNAAPIINEVSLGNRTWEAPGKVQAHVKVTEEGSGIDSIQLQFKEKRTKYIATLYAAMGEGNLTEVSKNEYVVNAELPENAPSGDYALTFATARDKVGYTKDYYDENSSPLKGVQLQVKNLSGGKYDYDPPVLKSISAEKKEAKAPSLVKLLMEIEDASDISEIYLYYNGSDGKRLDIRTNERETYSGSKENEVYLPINQYAQAGEYKLNYFSIKDKAGNYSMYSYTNSGQNGKKGFIRQEVDGTDTGDFFIYNGEADLTVINDLNPKIRTGLGDDNLASQLLAMEEGGIAVVSAAETKAVPKGVFEAIKGKDKTLVLESEGIQWIFNGNDLNSEIKDIDVGTMIEPVTESESEEYGVPEDGYKILFYPNGKLPGPAKIRINLGYEFYVRGLSGNAVLSWLNDETSQLEQVNSKVGYGQDSYTEFVLTHNSTYFLSNGHVHSYARSVTKATTSRNGNIFEKCRICGRTRKSVPIYYPKTISYKSELTYNGKMQRPSVTVKGSDGKVIGASNYKLSYSSGCKKIGHYKVTITFKGNYSGTVAKTFNINPKGTKLSKVKAAKKKATVKWKKQTKDTKGYQIQYSMDKNFKSGVKTKNVSGNKKTSVTLKGMKSKKTYYVRIRTYQNASGGKCYSSWSGAKKVKIK